VDTLTGTESCTHLVSYFRATIDTLHPYVPGRQPAPGTRVIKLNTNENPYSPSPLALDVLRQFDADRLRRYPHPLGDELRNAVSEVLGVDPTWVLPGNGSDELLTMLVRAVAGPGRPVVYPTPTYVLYQTLAEIQGAPVMAVPFDDSFTLPVDQLLAAQGALTFVANPNSPSGTAAPTEQLSALATALDGLLVIDEAYVAFADDDALTLARRHSNVVILRTLSKSHALAGLRLGFAIAQPAVVEGLAKVKDSYNVGVIAARVGAAALRDVAHTRSIVAQIKASRTRLAAALETRGCRVWPSQANFLLIRPPCGDAERVYRELEARGILVRFFGEAPFSDTLRITIGTDEEQTSLLEALDTILGGGTVATG
jgi:histidinol-phosphate aminotransferase